MTFEEILDQVIAHAAASRPPDLSRPQAVIGIEARQGPLSGVLSTGLAVPRLCQQLLDILGKFWRL
jgi:hypothetical protein